MCKLRMTEGNFSRTCACKIDAKNCNRATRVHSLASKKDFAAWNRWISNPAPPPQIVHVETQKLDCWLAKHSKHVLAERSATGWLLQIDFVRNDGMMSSLMKLKVCSLVPYPTKWHMCRAAMWVDTLLKWSYLSSHSKEQYQGRQHVDICIFFIHSNFNHHLLFVEASTIVRNPLLKIPEISPSTVSGWKRCLFSFGEFAIFSSLIFYFHGRTIFYVYHLFVAWT